jgi:molybdenum cofactor cytidylyltransferase
LSRRAAGSTISGCRSIRNLLLLGHVGEQVVLGLLARSPKVNGFDWVLERLVAGLPVGPAKSWDGQRRPRRDPVRPLPAPGRCSLPRSPR